MCEKFLVHIEDNELFFSNRQTSLGLLNNFPAFSLTTSQYDDDDEMKS